jgi:hypothetical protein
MALKSLVNASAETFTDAPDEELAAALEVADELDELDDDELLPQAAIPMLAAIATAAAVYLLFSKPICVTPPLEQRRRRARWPTSAGRRRIGRIWLRTL